MIVAFTGHRPHTFPGAPIKDLDKRLVRFFESVIPDLIFPCTEVISGLAEGVDMAVAEAAMSLGIPVRAAIPFEGQERLWQGSSQTRYRWLRARCHSEHIVFPFPDRAAYRLRDEWMVEHAQVVVGLCGKKDGGTAYTLDYANRWAITNVNLWKLWCDRNH